jgi:hypothetical protein
MAQEADREAWTTLSEEVLTGMRDWRAQHPKATLHEIETELDLRLAGLRARMLQDLALRSATTDWQQPAADAPPVCSVCGTALIRRGRHTRQRKTQGGQTIALTRSYGLCPTCKRGLFPPRR